MPLQTVLRVDGAALGGEEQAERRRAKLCERLDISVPEAGGGGNRRPLAQFALSALRRTCFLPFA